MLLDCFLISTCGEKEGNFTCKVSRFNPHLFIVSQFPDSSWELQTQACIPGSTMCSCTSVLGCWSFIAAFTAVVFPYIINKQTLHMVLWMDNVIILSIAHWNQNGPRQIFTSILGDLADIRQAERYLNIISKEEMKVFHNILICTWA